MPRDAQGAVYHSGIRSTDALTALIHGREIVCRKTAAARYFTVDGGLDLGAAMVAKGWAVACQKYSKDHMAIEDVAREGRAGMWAGTLARLPQLSGHFN